MPTTPIEIPREGDLKDAPPAARDELIALRNTIHDTEGSTDDSRKMIDAAISSGSRGEVVRALQTLQTRTEFGRLRDRIEASRISVSNNNVGLMDQAIVHGEQQGRNIYNNLPNWLKLGAITGGATWLTSRLLWIPTRLFGGKEAGDGMLKWGNTAALAIGGTAAAAKAVADVATSRTTLTSSLIRQVPYGPRLFGTENPSVDMQERTKRVRDALATVAFVDPNDPTNLRIQFPDLGNRNDFPIELLRVTQYVGERSLGSTDITPMPTGPAGSRRRSTDPGVTSFVIEFRVAGNPNVQTMPAVSR